MEDGGSKRKGKRIREDDDEDYNLTLASTQEETPEFVRVLMEALKRNACPYLSLTKSKITREVQRGNWQSLLPNIFSVDLPCGPRSSNLGTSAGGSVVIPPSTSSPPRISGSGGQKLQLCVETKMPTYLFSGEIIKGDGGSVIYVFLRDSSSGNIVQTGPASAAKLNVVVLEGDFNEEISDGWEHDFFESRQVKERPRKPPLLVGTVQVKLEGGVGIFGDLSFTDNSSWTRSKHFRLGFVLASGFFEGIRVMEAKTDKVRVKDRRGKTYEKRDRPALHDKVWRLKNIAKDGPLHKSLDKAEIRTVEDLTRLHVKDPQRLRTILGKGMTETMWETTIKHAMSFFPLGDKFYVYYTDETKSSGVIFNHIHVLRGVITGRQVVLLESLDQTQQKSRVKKAYENWDQVVECDEQLSSIIAEQASSINHNITPIQTGHTFQSVHQIQPDYTPVPSQIEGSLVDEMPENGELVANFGNFNEDDFCFNANDFARLFGPEPLPVYRVNAIVGWVKIKVAFKWGMMVSIAANKRKRAKLVELDRNTIQIGQ